MSNAISGTAYPGGPSYDPVARALHWAIAALAVIVVSLGLAIPEAPRNLFSRDLLLTLHRSVGLSILALTIMRALWRIGHRPPQLPASLRRIEGWLAHANHVGLYLLFIAMPLAGYINSAAAGHSVSFFGLFAIPPLVPRSLKLSQAAIATHLTLQFVIYAFVAMHVAAALMHLVVRRDGVFERMLPRRRRRPGELAAQSATPAGTSASLPRK